MAEDYANLLPMDAYQRRGLRWFLEDESDEMRVEPAPAVIVYTLNQGRFVYDSLSKSWSFVPPAQPAAFSLPQN
jgi:hypothetical protein